MNHPPVPTSQYISLPPPVDDRAGTDAVRGGEGENGVHLYKFCLTGFYDQFGEEDRKEAENACMP